MSCPTFSHRLDEDAKFLQAHVSSSTHPNNADSQTLRICKKEIQCPQGLQQGDSEPVLSPFPSLGDVGLLSRGVARQGVPTGVALG